VGYAPYHYQWSAMSGDTNQTITGLTAGNYMVQVSDLYNCTATATVVVVNQNDIFASTFNVQPGGSIYSLTPVTISVLPNAGWTLIDGYLSDGTSLALVTDHTFEESGDYTANYYFTSNHGCIDTVAYDIHVIDYSTIYIPNTFSPNNDGINDLFKAEGTFIDSFEMYIYDRWDNLVIRLDDITKGWNGKQKGQDAPIDVYVYKGSATDVSGKQINFKGQINLIR
jgi:gliding motility-associated-like protein